MPKLEHVLSTADPETVYGLLEQDGAVVVENILSEDHLEKLNSELDALVCSTDPGLRHPAHERMVEFYGLSTIRFDGLPAKSEAFVEIMLTPLLCAAADHFLLPNCHDYIFNTGQLIQIGPGETAQRLHRDEDAWSFLAAPKKAVAREPFFGESASLRTAQPKWFQVAINGCPSVRRGKRKFSRRRCQLGQH